MARRPLVALRPPVHGVMVGAVSSPSPTAFGHSTNAFVDHALPSSTIGTYDAGSRRARGDSGAPERWRAAGGAPTRCRGRRASRGAGPAARFVPSSPRRPGQRRAREPGNAWREGRRTRRRGRGARLHARAQLDEVVHGEDSARLQPGRARLPDVHVSDIWWGTGRGHWRNDRGVQTLRTTTTSSG